MTGIRWDKKHTKAMKTLYYSTVESITFVAKSIPDNY
jgi:hypothetical protein